MTQPEINVGILAAEHVGFTLTGIYSTCEDAIVTGRQCVRIAPGGDALEWEDKRYENLTFTPTSADGDSFELEGVTIGVNFHWERKENQRFRGALCLLAYRGKIIAINRVPVEEYLVSVISSEMSATSSPALLRAHAVISRSWVMARLADPQPVMQSPTDDDNASSVIIRWWDREDHELFDVCADDHCQRYQGIARAEGKEDVRSAVTDTRGMVLADPDGALCDTRFSKCCGGVFERFENCWADTPKKCLDPRRDWENPMGYPDLTIEAEAARWIEGDPESYCNTVSRRILSQVLNNYDREDTDFYRWTVSYTTERLSSLVRDRLGRDLGTITDLIPLQRGTSGRIVRLLIKGTLGEVVIGKELMIRRTLSESHLRSSAFTVTKTEDGFVLRGAGWGHGVGLCQIGAAVMGEKGFAWQEILSRYYPGSKLKTLY